jgi:hypothetical protein
VALAVFVGVNPIEALFRTVNDVVVDDDGVLEDRVLMV